MNSQNKKFYLAGLAVVLAGFVFGLSALPASAFAEASADKLAADCENNQEDFSFLSFLNPVASLVEKVIKGFGYDVALAQTSGWTFCANEGGWCSFFGAREVQYGADNRYAYRVSVSGIGCNNGVFGDPAPGWGKQCSYGGSEWTFCANESGYCSFSGTHRVAYGADYRYVTGIFTDGIGCNNGMFGDPAPGWGKQCYYESDLCGSDSVSCSGTTPTATVSWTAAPAGFSYYILTVSGIGSWSTGLNTSFTFSPGLYKCPAYNNTIGSIYVCPAPYTCNGQFQTGSTCIGSDHGDPCYWYHTYSCAVWPGLANNTLYNWSVEAYSSGGTPSASFGYTNQPSGSFTTPNCAPPPGNFTLSLGGSVACNFVPLSWTASSNAEGYKILKGAARVDITPYQPYTAQNFTDTTVSQNTTYIYQIEAYNAAGTNRSNVISVTTPYCPPTINFSANPTSIFQGQSVTLTWSTSYATSCTASGSWSGSKPTSGSETVIPSPPPSATYTLTCSGSGGSAAQSVTINITPLALPDWREVIPR